MAVCYFLAVFCLGRAQKNSGIVTAVLEGAPLSEKTAQEVLTQEEEQENFIQSCFWGELQKTEISCLETGKSSRIVTIVTGGNPELVMPGTLPLQWQADGCFIDVQTAEELFGTKEAAGLQIWYGEKGYTVCGTFESLRRIVIRQAGQEDKDCLDMVSLRGNTQDAEQFFMRNGLSGETAEFSSAGILLGDILLILPILLAASVFRFLWKSGIQTPMRWGKVSGFAGAGLVLSAAFWLIWRYFRIPPDMIPSKWSDFTFWSEWWKRQQQNLLRILGSAQGEMQLMLLWNFVLSFFANLIAVFCGITVVKRSDEK